MSAHIEIKPRIRRLPGYNRWVFVAGNNKLWNDLAQMWVTYRNDSETAQHQLDTFKRHGVWFKKFELQGAPHA